MSFIGYDEWTHTYYFDDTKLRGLVKAAYEFGYKLERACHKIAEAFQTVLKFEGLIKLHRERTLARKRTSPVWVTQRSPREVTQSVFVTSGTAPGSPVPYRVRSGLRGRRGGRR